MDTCFDPAFFGTPIGGGLVPLGYADTGADDQVACFMWCFERVCLLDIRLRAHSRWYPHWNKSALQAKWGSRYVHEKRLGNVNYQYPDREISLFDPEAVLPWVLDQLQQGVILLLVCACRDYERCHRKVVREFILRRCEDAVRQSGMRFDLARNVYVGLLPGGDRQVVVSPGLFELFSSFVRGDAYDPQAWVDLDLAFDLVMLEKVAEGGEYAP